MTAQLGCPQAGPSCRGLLRGAGGAQQPCRRESRLCPNTATHKQGDSGSLILSHRRLLISRRERGCRAPACRLCSPAVLPGSAPPAARRWLTACAAAAPIRCRKHCQAFQIRKIQGKAEAQLESSNTCQGCSGDDKGAGGQRGSAGSSWDRERTRAAEPATARELELPRHSSLVPGTRACATRMPAPSGHTRSSSGVLWC